MPATKTLVKTSLIALVAVALAARVPAVRKIVFNQPA